MSSLDFDHSIIGAGTAGCLLANRLSADPRRRVLLIEAGANLGDIQRGSPLVIESEDEIGNIVVGDDFFNAEKYPSITFKSVSVKKTGDKTYALEGDLTIRDVTKPVEIEVELNGVGGDPWGGTRIGFEGKTEISRKEYGLVWNVALEGGGPGWIDYETTLAAASPGFAPADIAETDLITINYTSGTTGRPKGVRRRPPEPDQTANMQNMLNAVCGFAPWVDQPETLRVLLSGPIHFALIYIAFGMARSLSPLVVASQLWIPFTALVAWRLLGETMSVPAVLGLIVAFVGVAYSALLRSTWHPKGLSIAADELVHDIVPLLVLLFWWRFAPKGTLRVSHIVSWLGYPAGYLAYSLARGAAEGWYPYYFLDVNTLGYPVVLKVSALITVAIVVMSALLVAVDRRLTPTRT